MAWREDYVTRQIRVIAAMIARMAGLRLEGNAEQAHAELEQAYGELLGERNKLVRMVDASTASSLLGSAEKIRLFAQLVSEEAEQGADSGHAELLRARAAELNAEAERRQQTL